MSKHTPGPWKVRDNEDGTLGIDANEPDGIACQPIQINRDANDVVLGPVIRANAQLIATAPDLLNALQHIVETADGAWDREDIRLRTGRTQGQQSRDAFQAISQIARAAIAKATYEE